MGMNGAGLGCGGAPEPFVEDVEDVVGPRVQMGGLCLPAGLLLTLAVAAKHVCVSARGLRWGCTGRTHERARARTARESGHARAHVGSAFTGALRGPAVVQGWWMVRAHFGCARKLVVKIESLNGHSAGSGGTGHEHDVAPYCAGASASSSRPAGCSPPVSSAACRRPPHRSHTSDFDRASNLVHHVRVSEGIRAQLTGSRGRTWPPASKPLPRHVQRG